MAPRYKLKLSKLDFISIVDEPAQPNAKCLLIKRAGKNDRISATARLVKTSDELGLAFFWAFTSTNADGSDHHDLQGDAISADDAMIKACAEFMENGGPADQQHDSSTIGKTVFAMPMTPEIAAAFGVITKTTGLMIAIRPSKEVLSKLKDGSYTGVSIAGLGERTPVEKGRVRKMAVLTSLTDGHQHSIDLQDPANGWIDMLSTSIQNIEGATTGHSHAWVHDMTTGAVTVASDSGHTHTVSDRVPAEVLAACAALMTDEQEDIAAIPAEIATESSDGVPVAPADEESSGVTVVVVQASAKPASKSTQAAAAPHGGGTMKLVVLTESQHAHYSKLAAADAEAFIAKTAAERDAIVKSAIDADPVVYKTTSGLEIRKSAGDVGVLLAKQVDEQAKAIAAQGAEIAKANLATETVTLAKRAGVELSHFAKTVNVRAAILKAVDGIPDEAVRKEALEALKGANAACVSSGTVKGVGGEDLPAAGEPSDAMENLEKGLLTFCKAQSITKNLWTDGLAAFVKTTEGAALKAALDETVHA